MALTYYDLLGVTPSATDKQIIAAYRAKARHYHPDNDDALSSEAIMAELNAAKETLLDVTKRSDYDYDLAHPLTKDQGPGTYRPTSEPRYEEPVYVYVPPTTPPIHREPKYGYVSHPSSTKSVNHHYWKQRSWWLFAVVVVGYVVGHLLTISTIQIDAPPLAWVGSLLIDIDEALWLVFFIVPATRVATLRHALNKTRLRLVSKKVPATNSTPPKGDNND
jgi:hypothetical protein